VSAVMTLQVAQKAGNTLSTEFSFSKNNILCEVNYEVQYDDIFIKATNIIFDANPSSGSGVDTDSKDGETCQDAYCNL
jgi:hypothetical protein